MKKGESSVMSKINAYIKSRERSLSGNPLYAKFRDKSVEQLIADYKDEHTSESNKSFLLEMIYLKVFFYFPSFISKKKYKLNIALYDDALQNISNHILSAINRFDPNKGYPFLAYAYGDIVSAVTRTFKELNLVHLPQGSRANKEKAYLKDTGAEASVPEVPDTSEYSVDSFVSDPEIGMYAAVENPEEYVNRDISADTILTSKTVLFTDTSCSETVDYDDELNRKQLVEWLEEALSEEAGVLTEDERMIVILHNGLFGHDPLVYSEIAALRCKEGKGCSRSRISQIHTKALQKIKKWFSALEIEE